MHKDTGDPYIQALHRRSEVVGAALVRQVDEERRSLGASIPAFASASGQAASTTRRKLIGQGTVYLRDLFAWAGALGAADDDHKFAKVIEWVGVAQLEADEAVPIDRSAAAGALL